MSNIPYVFLCVCVCTYHYFFICYSVGGHLGCFLILDIVNNAVVDIGVHISFWTTIFIFFRCIPSSGIPGSFGSSIFSFLRNLHRNRASLPSQQQCTRVPFSLRPHQCLLFVFVMIPILTVVMWFHCFSLNFSDYQCWAFFSCTCWTSVYFWKKWLFRSSAHF